MLRILYNAGGIAPYSWPVDPAAEFEPGRIAQLYAMGNQIVAGVSDGRIPIGIIDDWQSNAMYSTSIDEEVIIQVPSVGIGTDSGGNLVTNYDIIAELEYPNILAESFTSDVDIVLSPKNGNVTFIAGTKLNFSSTGSGSPDSLRAVVSYTYQIPNIAGDNSVLASGRVTVWTSRLIGQTDQFDTSQQYPLNAALYCSSNGKFTTQQPNTGYPAVGLVTAPPNSINGALEFLWF